MREQECDEPRKEIFLGTKKSNIAKKREEQRDTDPQRIALSERAPIGNCQRKNANGRVKRSCKQKCSDRIPATEETAARRKTMLRTIVEFLRMS